MFLDWSFICCCFLNYSPCINGTLCLLVHNVGLITAKLLKASGNLFSNMSDA